MHSSLSAFAPTSTHPKHIHEKHAVHWATIRLEQSGQGFPFSAMPTKKCFSPHAQLTPSTFIGTRRSMELALCLTINRVLSDTMIIPSLGVEWGQLTVEYQNRRRSRGRTSRCRYRICQAYRKPL